LQLISIVEHLLEDLETHLIDSHQEEHLSLSRGPLSIKVYRPGQRLAGPLAEEGTFEIKKSWTATKKEPIDAVLVIIRHSQSLRCFREKICLQAIQFKG
jgi:hypothetical protein